MHLQTSTTVTPNQVIKDLFNFLHEEFSPNEISDLFRISKKESELGRKRGVLDLEAFNRVKDKCGFSYANLYYNGLDHNSVRSHLMGKYDHIPKRYRDGAYSSKRTSHSILGATSETIAQDAVQFLQINEKDFYSDEGIGSKISTIMNSDLLKYLHECHFYNDETIYKLGQKSGVYNLNLPFAKAFKGYSVKESFARVVEEIMRHFETSFKYELVSLTEDQAVIRKYLSEKMKDSCGSNIYSNRHLCRYIEGSFSAITLYTTGKFAKTSQEKCVFLGDQYCEYHVSLKELRSL